MSRGRSPRASRSGSSSAEWSPSPGRASLSVHSRGLPPRPGSDLPRPPGGVRAEAGAAEVDAPARRPPPSSCSGPATGAGGPARPHRRLSRVRATRLATTTGGTDGAAVGHANGTAMTVMDILLAVDQHATHAATAAGFTLYAGDQTDRGLVDDLFGRINDTGGI